MLRCICRLSTVILLGFLFALAGGCKKEQQTDSGGAVAQPPAQPGATTQPALALGEQEAAGEPDKFAVGDLLDIEVSDLSGPNVTTSMPVRVPANGTVRLIFLDEPIKLQGKDRGEAEAAIGEAYRKANLVQHADVFVRRLQSARTGLLPGPIQPYELIRFSILDVSGPNTEDVRIAGVSGKGTLTLPYEGPINVMGMTESEAAIQIQKRYRDDNLIARAGVSVLRLEVAPANAAHLALTDAPLYPVPEVLKPLYFSWPQSPSQGAVQKGL